MTEDRVVGRRHRIYGILEGLDKAKAKKEGWSYSKPKKCPVLTPEQDCVGFKCVWFDRTCMECSILHPRPTTATGRQ